MSGKFFNHILTIFQVLYVKNSLRLLSDISKILFSVITKSGVPQVCELKKKKIVRRKNKLYFLN